MIRTALITILGLALVACDSDPDAGGGDTDASGASTGSDDSGDASGGEEAYEPCEPIACRNEECASNPREAAVIAVLVDEINAQGWADYVEVVDIEPDVLLGTQYAAELHVHAGWFSARDLAWPLDFEGDEPTAEEEADWRGQVGFESIGDVAPIPMIEQALAECDPALSFDRCENSAIAPNDDGTERMVVHGPIFDECGGPTVTVEARTGELLRCEELVPNPEPCAGK